MSKSPNVQNGANARSSLSDSANGAMAHRRLLPRVLEGCSCHMRTRFVNFDSIETLQDVHFSLADVPVYVLDAPAGAKFAVASLLRAIEETDPSGRNVLHCMAAAGSARPLLAVRNYLRKVLRLPGLSSQKEGSSPGDDKH